MIIGTSNVDRLRDPLVTKRGAGDYLVDAYGKRYVVQVTCGYTGRRSGWLATGDGLHRIFDTKADAIRYLKYFTIPAIY